MQPEVLFKETPLEVFLTAWCVADNYICKPLSSSYRVNQLGVSHIDSSIHRVVRQTSLLLSFFFSGFLYSSLRLWEECVIERETQSQWKHHLSKRRTYWHYRNNKCWELFSTDAQGPIKILTEWTEFQLVPDLPVTLFPLSSLFEWVDEWVSEW